jgi:hypothetical protein
LLHLDYNAIIDDGPGLGYGSHSEAGADCDLRGWWADTPPRGRKARLWPPRLQIQNVNVLSVPASEISVRERADLERRHRYVKHHTAIMIVSFVEDGPPPGLARDSVPGHPVPPSRSSD